MARNDIATSILSCAIPFTVLLQDATEIATLSRETNEYLASLRDQYPSNFGFFATVPSLDDTARCIEEIEYALSNLKADGVSLFTSYGEKYLGHPDFRPVWAELNRHATVIFTHPTMEGMEKSIQEPFLIPRALIDWSHETTRAAIHLIMTDTIRKFSACKIILSHGGGTLPFVAGRIGDIPMQEGLSGKKPEEFLDAASSFYFDLALVGHGAPLKLLMEFAKPGHVLYGSDYPFVQEEGVKRQLRVVNDVSIDNSTLTSIWEASKVDLDSNSESASVLEPLSQVTRQAAQMLFPRFTE
ncbi:MAG: hypothetical protein Q9201_002479 [Fulgogasparrea decipioides]